MKTSTINGELPFAAYNSAGKRFLTIPSSACTPAQVTFRNWGTIGNWYIHVNGKSLQRSSDGTVKDYSIKLGPTEEFTEENPPIGDVSAICDTTADGVLSFYAGWRDREHGV